MNADNVENNHCLNRASTKLNAAGFEPCASFSAAPLAVFICVYLRSSAFVCGSKTL